MKKKILGSFAVLAIAAFAAFNVNINTQEDALSAMTLDNVEALAKSELTEINCNTAFKEDCYKYNGVVKPGRKHN